MAARAARYVFFGLGICLTAAVCLYILRYVLLTQIVVHYFEARGLPKPRLQVTELNTRRITLEHLALGAAGEFSAGALRIEFSAASLRARRLHRISIEDATLHLDLAGEDPVLGTLQPLLGGGEGGAIAIETVAISTSRLLLATPHGHVQAMLAGTLTPLDNGALDARLRATVISEYGNTSASLLGVIAEDGTVSADVRLLDGLVILKEAELSGLEGTAKMVLKEGAPPQINANLALARVKFAGGDFDRATITLATAADDLSLELAVGGPTGHVRLEGRARIADYLGEAIADASVSVSMDARAALFSWLGLPQPERGNRLLTRASRRYLGRHHRRGAGWGVRARRLARRRRRSGGFHRCGGFGLPRPGGPAQRTPGCRGTPCRWNA